MYVGKTKAMVLALLALVGVMAISASAAQAKWLLLKNGTSVSSLNIKGSSSENSKLIIPGNGIEIECTGSEGSTKVSLSEENKKLSGSASVTFQGCEETEFGEVCETHSAGQPDGTIVVSDTFKGGDVSAEEIYFSSLSSNEQVTKVEFTGEECPLTEIDGVVTCHLKFTVLSALQNLALHVVHNETNNLKFGGEEGVIENESGGHAILGSTTEETGATFAFHLIGL